MALVDASADVLEALADQLDVPSLLALSQTSSSLHCSLRAQLADRCKRECFGAFLFPTIAAYRMQAPVPESWMQLYVVFSRLHRLRWSKCKSDGVSSSLRSLKSDNQEYLVDIDNEFMLRSGGHYWFSVWQTKADDIRIGRAFTDQPEVEENGVSENPKAASLAFMRSPRQILFGKWTKIRGVGRAPCPRRYHSMTSLPKTVCPASLMSNNDVTNGKITEVEDPDECIRVRRLLFFGGHSETMPFDAFNDLYVLFIEDSPDSTKTRAAWVAPTISGTRPTPRCGHTATLLSPDLLLFAGGSDGTSPIATLEVHLLHVDGLSTFRWSTPQSNELPMGRSLHEVHRVSRNELIIYGGRQIRESNGLLSVHRLQLKFSHPGNSSEVERLEWSSPRLTGSLPNGRRGHSTNAVGENLLLFGGQDEATGQLRNDVRVLHVPTLHWRRVDVPGEAPCPRRGFKSQFFGTSLVVSSGFVREHMDGKADRQLPDSDVHVLEFL